MGENHASSPVTENYVEAGGSGSPWLLGLKELQRASTFWVATTHPSGRAHVVPVLAVLSDGALHFAAGSGTRKARNLARDPRLTVTTCGDNLDVVVDGVVDVLRDEEALAAVATAYADKYGWEVEVREAHLHGEGAPTAGPPPYAVYRLTPHRAFGFPSTGVATPTRWQFDAPLSHRREV